MLLWKMGKVVQDKTLLTPYVYEVGSFNRMKGNKGVRLLVLLNITYCRFKEEAEKCELLNLWYNVVSVRRSHQNMYRNVKYVSSLRLLNHHNISDDNSVLFCDYHHCAGEESLHTQGGTCDHQEPETGRGQYADDAAEVWQDDRGKG